MKKNVYGVVKYGPARKGILSIVLGLVAMAMFVVILYLALKNSDGLAAIWGAVALIAVVVSVYGIWNGIRSRHEPNRTYTVSVIGVVLNLVVLVGFLSVFILGVR